MLLIPREQHRTVNMGVQEGYDSLHSTSQCILARLQKCGGTTLAQGISHSAALGIHLNATVIREWGGLVAADFFRGGVVIAQIRNPWTYYASLWSYLSDIRDQHGAMGFQPKIDSIYSEEMPRGNSSVDRRRFARFVRAVGHPQLGVFSMHVWVNYALALGGNENFYHMPLGSTVSMAILDSLKSKNITLAASDIRRNLFTTLTVHSRKRLCWVHAENMTDDAKQCLQLCGAAMNASLPKSALDEFADRISARKNPSSAILPLAMLYAEDTALVSYVQRADAALFRAFPEYPGVPYGI